MGQLNIYVPDDVEENIRNQSKKENKSISKFISDLFLDFQQGRRNVWQKEFFSEVVGKWHSNQDKDTEK
ncbi:MAG: hypothetical protein ACD_62C00608G0001 [uncultured bacterium]|nr:MAG: hypothetical protein ACD_62C00608G0001 [uncultured bacterium]